MNSIDYKELLELSKSYAVKWETLKAELEERAERACYIVERYPYIKVLALMDRIETGEK